MELFLMSWMLSAFADEASQKVDEQITTLLDAKIQYVDLRNVDGINIVELPLDHAKQVKTKLDASGISVCMYGSPIGKIDITDDFEIDRKRVRHLGELKKVFGASAVRLFSYFNKKGADEATWRRVSIERLTELAKMAGDLGLILYHENEIGIYGGPVEKVCVLRDEVHAQSPDTFRLIFDFDNFNQNQEDVWADWLTLRDAIGAIHLKESKRQPDGSYQHVPAGEGDGRIPEVLADLAKRGWNGPLTLEPHLARSPAVVATGAHGSANASLADMSEMEVFQVAAKAARKLLADVGRL
ncbi:MAG: TIM barrel protein [Planctomycetes bacterium]|nr:TIM barrel protein [Planctomycetota bacterium]